MSRRINRVWPLLACLLASEVWALGLGDIRLNSALNEPLRAEIELLSATPEDLESLKVSLASADTFDRYGIDRPVFLTRIRFDIERRGGGTRIVVQSPQPIIEPFLTFLVEANWARGRLLREYTVLLDPPTFAPPPAADRTEAVAAPQRATQADRGRIERPAPPPAPSQPSSQSSSQPPASDSGAFDTGEGRDYQVRRGDTLWRIAERVRPDDRLTMNQTMIAIYESNPDAFAGNINVLRADTRLRIPGADQIFRISRGDALTRVQRQYDAWSGAAPAEQQPSLTLVAPDDDQEAYRGGTTGQEAGQSAATADRIRRLEQQVAEQESLLEVRDNELAQLRAELARLREQRAAAGTAEPLPADETPDTADETAAEAGDEIFVEDESATDREVADEVTDEPAVADTADEPSPQVVTRRREEPGLLDTIIGALTGIWGLIGLLLLVVVGVLVWFARRASGGGDDTDSTGVWDALDADDVDSESVATTERLRALSRDDDTSIVVVEQGRGAVADDTVEAPAARRADSTGTFESPALRETGEPVSLEDTFSSDTAINLDQSDPIAEADFHMAYGLYDQAADLINGALAVEPERTDLLAKLCEVYFVWGNRDAFVEAAERYREAIGEDAGDWDKIVIMGQQIAGDHAMFGEGSLAAGAARSVDLAFDEDGEDVALDMDFASEAGGDSDVVDFGAGDSGDNADIFDGGDDDLDFPFDDEEPGTSETITQEVRGADNDPTVESPTVETEAQDPTMESPTIEQPFDSDDVDSTSELPAMSDYSDPFASGDSRADATAEIDLDDLGLDLGSLSDDFASDDDILSDLDDTGRSQAVDDDSTAETGRGRALGTEDTDVRTDADVSVDDELRDATGETQVLPEDFTLDTGNRKADLSDDDATMLAPAPGSDDPDFDFSSTEALPDDSFDRDASSAETGEMPSLAGSTDMDLDLDDLTAALKISEDGDTVDQPRDEPTIEQPSLQDGDDIDFDLGMDETSSEDPTQALSPDDVADDLNDARTMTEVGTKLDLARAYVDMGDPGGARNILEEVLDEGDESQRQQAQQLLDTLPG